GSTVLRFHGQGYGDSDRLLEAVSVAGHIDDAVQTADVLRAETGCTEVGFLGIRFGGAVALAAGGRGGAAAAVVVDPVVTGRAYLEPLIRAAVTTELVQRRHHVDEAAVFRAL